MTEKRERKPTAKERRIAQLEAEVASLKKKLEGQPSKVWWGIRNHGLPFGFLPEGQPVTFQTSDDEDRIDAYIEVRLDGDAIEVRCGRQMAIAPRVSNGVTIRNVSAFKE